MKNPKQEEVKGSLPNVIEIADDNLDLVAGGGMRDKIVTNDTTDISEDTKKHI